MTEILTFIDASPWQTFFLGPFVFTVFAVLCFYIFGLLTTVFKTVRVVFRGWPPIHLDISGEFKALQEQSESSDISDKFKEYLPDDKKH